MKTDDTCLGIHSLVGGLIREEGEHLMLSKHVLYPFKIILGASFLTLYAIRKEEKDKWVQAIKEAIGYSNLSDFYDLKVSHFF